MALFFGFFLAKMFGLVFLHIFLTFGVGYDTYNSSIFCFWKCPGHLFLLVKLHIKRFCVKLASCSGILNIWLSWDLICLYYRCQWIINYLIKLLVKGYVIVHITGANVTMVKWSFRFSPTMRLILLIYKCQCEVGIVSEMSDYFFIVRFSLSIFLNHQYRSWKFSYLYIKVHICN